MRKNHGFTLIELLIVITIIGILTVLGARQFGNAVARANATTDLANAQTIANGLRQAIIMGDIVGDFTGALSAIDTSTDSGDTAVRKTDVTPVAKYIGAIPAIKTTTATWNVAIDVDEQDVTVSANTTKLSPRPADSALGAWANAQ